MRDASTEAGSKEKARLNLPWRGGASANVANANAQPLRAACNTSQAWRFARLAFRTPKLARARFATSLRLRSADIVCACRGPPRAGNADMMTIA